MNGFAFMFFVGVIVGVFLHAAFEEIADHGER